MIFCSIISNLSATFTEPGQYVEYTFYARNEGEYTAYLNSINYFGEKTCESSEEISSNVQSACDSIALKVYVEDSEYLGAISASRVRARTYQDYLKLRLKAAVRELMGEKLLNFYRRK